MLKVRKTEKKGIGVGKIVCRLIIRLSAELLAKGLNSVAFAVARVTPKKNLPRDHNYP